MMKFCPNCANPLDRQTRDSHLRLVCTASDCDFIHWNNPTPVVAAVIEYQEQVLLVHHVGWPPKMLGLVSGFLEAREHPDDAMRREILEETSLRTHRLELLGHYPFPEQNQIIIAYAAGCTGEVSLNDELDRYKLIDPKRVIPWPMGTGPAVKDWLEARLNNMP